VNTRSGSVDPPAIHNPAITHRPVMHDLAQIARLFDLRADFVHGHPYGSGHINDTYCAWADQAGTRVRFIIQRINHNVFKDPVALSENVARVTGHALRHLHDEGHPEARRRTLTVVPALDGRPYAVDDQGNTWRVYPFIERARGYDEITDNRQAEETAKAFGNFQKLTADLAGRYPRELSGGQCQRVCIARALAMNPEIMLLDEPTSALDPKATAHIEELIEELKKQVTIVMVTHNIAQAARISDYTAFIYLGELVEYGTTQKMFTVPQDKRTEEYLTGKFG